MLKHDVAQKGVLRKQAGFTLIELLIVIAIIAILAAIAIPQFLKYKQGAYVDSVRSDVKNAVTAMEAYQATHGAYPTKETTCDGTNSAASCDLGTGTAITGGGGDLNVSKGNTITITEPAPCTTGNGTTGPLGYTVTGTTTNVPSYTATYNSCTGQYTGF